MSLQITKEREDVWCIYSDLFLDTEVTDADLESIAKNLAATSFSVDDLISIMEDEVAPVLHPNLMTVAGEWAFFHREEQVVKPITERLLRIPDVRRNGWFPFAWLRRRFHMMVVKPDWEKVVAHLRRLRGDTVSGA